MDPLELLKVAIENSSKTQVMKELGISKTALSQVLNEKYPNPSNIYHKIKQKYGHITEIVGVDSDFKMSEKFDGLKRILKDVEDVGVN